MMSMALLFSISRRPRTLSGVMESTVSAERTHTNIQQYCTRSWRKMTYFLMQFNFSMKKQWFWSAIKPIKTYIFMLTKTISEMIIILWYFSIDIIDITYFKHLCSVILYLIKCFWHRIKKWTNVIVSNRVFFVFFPGMDPYGPLLLSCPLEFWIAQTDQ